MLVFTEHAIERFITRIAPELTRAEALAYLQAEAPSAAKMREKTAVGSTMWRLGDVVAISKRDPGKPDDVVVTIVPSRYADIREGVPSHEIAMALERIEARDEWPPLTVPMPAGPKPTTTRPVAAAQVVAVKPVKRPLHKHPPRASDVDVLLHIVELEGGLQRQREKTMRHLATFDAQLSKLRHALRIAVRRLRANGDEETLASIRAPLERDCHVLRLRAENAEAALLAAELRAKRELAEARVDLTNCADVGRRLEIELRRAVAEAAEADTTRREWEVRAATSYADGRKAGLREAAEACDARAESWPESPESWFADPGMRHEAVTRRAHRNEAKSCAAKIRRALAPPAAEPRDEGES